MRNIIVAETDEEIREFVIETVSSQLKGYREGVFEIY